MSGNEEVLKNAPPTVEQPETTDLGYLRRLEKSVALLSKIAAVSVFSVVGSFCVVLALFPLKKTETVFVSMKDGQQMVRLLPQEIDRTTKEEYIRSVLFDYIRKRETINFVDEGERFAWVQAFTHPQWFKLFGGTYELEQSRQSVALLRKARADAGYLCSVVGINSRHGSHLACGIHRDRPEKRTKRQNEEFCGDFQSLYGTGSDGQDESEPKSVWFDC